VHASLTTLYAPNCALQLQTAKNALAKAREQHRETEAALRKAKKRAQQV